MSEKQRGKSSTKERLVKLKTLSALLQFQKIVAILIKANICYFQSKFQRSECAKTAVARNNLPYSIVEVSNSFEICLYIWRRIFETTTRATAMQQI